MTTLNIATIKTELLNKLDYIADNFFESAVQNSLLVKGSLTNPTFGDITSTNGVTKATNDPLGYFANTLLDGYTFFDSRYGDDITGTHATAAAFSRYTCNVNSTYTQVAATTSDVTDPQEINMSKFVGTGTTLMKHLNATRQLYSLLDPKNYKRYVNLVKTNDTTKTHLNINQYELTGTTNSTKYVVVDSTTNNLNEMKKLIVSLRGGIPLTTSDLVTTTANSAYNKVSAFPVNTPARVFRYGTHEDVVVQVERDTGVSASYLHTTSIMPVDTTDKYVTVSMLVRARQEGSDPTSASLTLILDTVTASDTQPRQVTKEFEVERDWQRIVISRLVPTGKECKLIIKTESPILITEVQSDVNANSETSGAYAAPLFQNETNLFVLRRLLYLCELIANFYIAVKVYSKSPPNSSLITYTSAMKDAEIATAKTAFDTINDDAQKTPTEKAAAKATYDAAVADANSKFAADAERTRSHKVSNLVNLNYSALKYFNENMIASTKANPNAITRITKVMNQRANNFKKTSEDITTLDSMLVESKQTMKMRMENVTAQQKKGKKVKLFMYITLVMMITIAGAAAIAIMAPLEEKQRIMLSLGVVSGGIVVSTILNLVYNTKIEGFQAADVGAGVALIDPNNLAGGVTTANLNKVGANASIWILSQASLYLSNTIYLALTLQSYATYGNINHTLNKERKYFAYRLRTMDRTNERIGQLADMSKLEKNNARSKMVYFIFIIVLVSITTGLLVLTKDIQGMKNVVLIGAGIMLLIGTTMFLMETSGRVRTSGDQYYWGKPSTDGL